MVSFSALVVELCITSAGNDGPKIAGASGAKRGQLFFFCEVS
jgi:hypothetical protein